MIFESEERKDPGRPSEGLYTRFHAEEQTVKPLLWWFNAIICVPSAKLQFNSKALFWVELVKARITDKKDQRFN